MDDKKRTYSLVLGALGIVFGDIGTSPLYAFREALFGSTVGPLDVLGVLSLIFWSLIFVISIKYLLIVFRADNEGEGGVLALLALLKQKRNKNKKLFYLLAIFGAGLVLGDGMITPAISVISAIEGLKTVSPFFYPLILPMSATILIGLFLVQSRGTFKIGQTFGLILLLWFVMIAILGAAQIIRTPRVLMAISPYYAFKFLLENGSHGYLALGGIFLVVTGGEALYSDMGHFGKRPIRISWFSIVLPALVLNYFGQGANLLLHPEAAANPFFMLAPPWFYIPFVIISTVAAIIASQAVISATFSITKQAILLGLVPRIPIVQTSKEYIGQVYIPQMNFFLLLGTLTLIFTFKSSSGMAHAYGIAVNLNMLIVTILVTYAARVIWNWPFPTIAIVFGFFLIIDLGFMGANFYKFLTGGWVPVFFALFIAFIMLTWRLGLEYLNLNFYAQKASVTKIIRQLKYRSLQQLKGVTAIFITDNYNRFGGSFLNFLRLSLTVPENILILNYVVRNRPYVSLSKRFKIQHLDKTIFQITLRYGFMETIAIPEALEQLNKAHLLPFTIPVNKVAYLVEVPNIIASKNRKTLMFYWQERVFSFLMRNYSANLNIEFYKLPYDRTIAIGTYCII